MDEGGGGSGGGAQQVGAGEASEGCEGQGGSGYGSAPRGNPVCSGGADLDYAADVGNSHCHRVGAAAPEALHRVCIRSHILGALRQVEGGAGKWAGEAQEEGEERGAPEEAREGEEEIRE